MAIYVDPFTRDATRREVVRDALMGHCPACSKEVYLIQFLDAISIREFGISGLCQSCQDDIFCNDEEE